MKYLIVLYAALMMAGCERQAETTTRVGLDFQVDKLFTVDGCTVYRFEDGGRSRYFTNCSGQTQWFEGCGKSCTREQSVIGGQQ